MSKLISSKQVEKVIRRLLEDDGYSLSPTKKQGETGADITAKKSDSTYFIEVIGFQSHPPIRSREFYEAFFRAISRDRNNPNNILVIGLPIRFKNGMKQRKYQYPIAWEKLGRVFPNLKLWYIDTEQNTMQERFWNNPYD